MLETKKGNSAEINLLLTVLLQESGLEAYPVLISTKGHETINRDFPDISSFNQIISIVIIDGNEYLLDATSKLRPYDLLAIKDLNRDGLLLDKKKVRWVDIKPGKSNSTIIYSNLDLQKDKTDQLQYQVNIKYTGYEAYFSRNNYITLGEEKYIQKHMKMLDASPVKVEFKNTENIDEPFQIDFTLPANSEIIGDILYIQPFIKKHFDENPFKVKERQFPIDFLYPNQEVFLFKMTIPENYQIDDLPENLSIALPDKKGYYVYSVTQMDNLIQISSRLVLTEYFFWQDYYPHLKEMFDQVIIKQNEQIVLKKK